MENAKCYAPQILVGTEGLPREQWLEYRRKGIGGSDAAAVLGISPFRTGRDLYYDKLNIVTADDAENWVQLEVGTLLEPLVAKIFAHKTGYKIYRRPFMFQHPLYPWMLADLDYMVELPDGTTAILEIKTTNITYEGCRGINQSVLDRMNLTQDVELPSPEIMAQRAMSVTGCEDDYMVSQMVRVVNDMSDFCRKNSISDGSCGMRSLIDWIMSTEVTGDPYESALYTIISRATANEEDQALLKSSVLEPVFAPKRKSA